MDIGLFTTEIRELEATDKGAIPGLDMRRIRFGIPGNMNWLTIWLNDAQARKLYAELERVWKITAPVAVVPDEVVNAYADEHAGELDAEHPAMSQVGKTVFDLTNETNRATAKALGINPLH